MIAPRLNRKHGWQLTQHNTQNHVKMDSWRFGSFLFSLFLSGLLFLCICLIWFAFLFMVTHVQLLFSVEFGVLQVWMPWRISVFYFYFYFFLSRNWVCLILFWTIFWGYRGLETYFLRRQFAFCIITFITLAGTRRFNYKHFFLSFVHLSGFTLLLKRIKSFPSVVMEGCVHPQYLPTHATPFAWLLLSGIQLHYVSQSSGEALPDGAWARAFS